MFQAVNFMAYICSLYKSNKHIQNNRYIILKSYYCATKVPVGINSFLLLEYIYNVIVIIINSVVIFLSHILLLNIAKISFTTYLKFL